MVIPEALSKKFFSGFTCVGYAETVTWGTQSFRLELPEVTLQRTATDHWGLRIERWHLEQERVDPTAAPTTTLSIPHAR